MNEPAEITKIENYISRVIAAIESLCFYPRSMQRYPFDTIASSMMSKSIAIARSSITLLEGELADEAYGLSRSIVECALILRYITSDPDLQASRSADFVLFSVEYKNLWLYHARNQFAGTPEADEIERYAKQWRLTGDPIRAKKHWSKLRSFTWDAQSLAHPLDAPAFDISFKEKQYAVDYFQTCQWVHCSQPALDNYVPDEGRPFRFTKSSDDFGNPGHSVLYILLNYCHSVMCYALFGLGVARPKDVDVAFSETLALMAPWNSKGVQIA